MLGKVVRLGEGKGLTYYQARFLSLPPPWDNITIDRSVDWQFVWYYLVIKGFSVQRQFNQTSTLPPPYSSSSLHCNLMRSSQYILNVPDNLRLYTCRQQRWCTLSCTIFKEWSNVLSRILRKKFWDLPTGVKLRTFQVPVGCSFFAYNSP